jgi:antitoxin HicB
MNTMYPVVLTADDDGGFVVEFPGLPFGVTQGDDLSEAMANAEDALVVVISTLIDDGQEVPEPLSGDFEYHVRLPDHVALKLALHRAFRASGINKAELGRRLSWGNQQVARLFDARHLTRVDHLFSAFRALNTRVDFTVAPIVDPEEKATS